MTFYWTLVWYALAFIFLSSFALAIWQSILTTFYKAKCEADVDASLRWSREKPENIDSEWLDINQGTER